MSAPSAAPNSGKPDFAPPGNITVTGPSTPVPNGGDNDFEKGGGQKHVSGPGEVNLKQAYVTEKKSRSADSYF